MSRALAELLLSDKIINQDQYAKAKQDCGPMGRSLVRYFIENKAVSESKLLYYLSQKYSLPTINLAKFEIGKTVTDLLSIDQVKKYQAIPIQSNSQTIVLALCDPTMLERLDDLRFKLERNIETVLTTFSAFDTSVNKYYAGAAFVDAAIESFHKDALKKKRKSQQKGKKGKFDVDEDDIEFIDEKSQIHELDVGSMDQDAPVITLVNGLLGEAVSRGASDIHVEPYEKRVRVRMRMDGMLHEVALIPMEMKRAVTARFKIMSNMDLAESRIPQDGRIKLKAAGREIDFRVNTIPTQFGEKVVLRLLDSGSISGQDLQRLGFDNQQIQVFRHGIAQPNGMVLVTGPTGSGKTTTLYSALNELNKAGDNLSTVEDPIEYNLDGVNQVQVHKEIGLTFSNILRALLRQDPDTILVGEIRDFETAEVAIQAALTGHLVLSTVHTNDAPSTIVRLMNMGIEPFLICGAVNTIIAQRLVRRICQKCLIPHPIPQEKLLKFGFPESRIPRIQSMKGKGCSACADTGYKGRLAIYEIMDFNSELKEMVLTGSTSIELKRKAMQLGMKSLRASALNRAAEGHTTFEEALSITMEV